MLLQLLPSEIAGENLPAAKCTALLTSVLSQHCYSVGTGPSWFETPYLMVPWGTTTKMTLPCMYGSSSAYEMSLENQSGHAMKIGKEDREAIVTALMLHESAKQKIQQAKHTLLRCGCQNLVWSAATTETSAPGCVGAASGRAG